jgi:hypothetical protein
MDPDANLTEQLRLAARMIDDSGRINDSERLAELVIALSHWIECGGFLPKLWAEARPMTLALWSSFHGKTANVHTNGIARWIPDFVGDSRSELWRLDDYIVSSVCGGTIWLLPRGIR